MWTPKAKQEFLANISLSLSLSLKKSYIFFSYFCFKYACLRYLILSCLGGFCAEENSHM